MNEFLGSPNKACNILFKQTVDVLFIPIQNLHEMSELNGTLISEVKLPEIILKVLKDDNLLCVAKF